MQYCKQLAMAKKKKKKLKAFDYLEAIAKHPPAFNPKELKKIAKKLKKKL